MTSSLEQLLAEDGFRKRSRASIRTESMSHQDQRRILKNGRTRSDVSQGKFATSNSSLRRGRAREMKSIKQPGTSYESYLPGVKNTKILKAAPDFALDKVAVQAMVSILNGYIKRFLKDEEFRSTMRQNCISCLGFPEKKEDDGIENRVITNLEDAIEIVEKAADEAASAKDLKKASVQLSLISGLNSNDLKDGYTSRIANSRLSACAHLYLSVIYKLQNKDRISAKRLLQVFCDSPFLARTLLLPELWDNLFFPHLSDLKIWYNQETDSLPNTLTKIRKLELSDKIDNETIDSSTYQLAVYYKDRLTEGIEALSAAPIDVPYGAEDDADLLGHSSNGASSSGDSTIEVKQALTSSSEIVKYVDGDIKQHSSNYEQDNMFLPVHRLLSASKEEWKPVKVSVSPEANDINVWQETMGENLLTDDSSCAKENEVIVKRLAKSFFQPQQTEDSYKLTNSVPSHLNQSIKAMASCDESYGSIPQDFICPLTGHLFEDPVTLETGQTFEREAINKWFIEGNKTCPVTGKTLEYASVPLTNFILKRVIGNWKLEHCSSN